MGGTPSSAGIDVRGGPDGRCVGPPAWKTEGLTILRLNRANLWASRVFFYSCLCLNQKKFSVLLNPGLHISKRGFSMFKKQGICCFDVSSFALAPSVFGGAERVCDDVGDGALREG